MSEIVAKAEEIASKVEDENQNAGNEDDAGDVNPEVIVFAFLCSVIAIIMHLTKSIFVSSTGRVHRDFCSRRSSEGS